MTRIEVGRTPPKGADGKLMAILRRVGIEDLVALVNNTWCDRWEPENRGQGLEDTPKVLARRAAINKAMVLAHEIITAELKGALDPPEKEEKQWRY
jgi:hypothetical protein